MLKVVILYGELRKRFGREFTLEVESVAEAVHALASVVPGFKQYIRDTQYTTDYRVVVDGVDQSPETVMYPIGSAEVVKIVPLVSGAHGGLKNFIPGLIMYALAAAFYVAGAFYFQSWAFAVSDYFYAAGNALMLAGAVSMLSKPPTTGSGMNNKDAETWSFNAPALTTGQGGPVPLGYGLMKIGGNVISAGIDSMAFQDKGFGGLAPDNNGTIGGDGSTTPWVCAVAP
jgi:predicted phage tail protein